MRRSARILGVEIAATTRPTRSPVARGARRRIANRILRRVRDVAEVRHQGSVTAGSRARRWSCSRSTSAGLERESTASCSRRSWASSSGGPVGLSTLAVSLGEEADTIEDVYEPYLLQLGFIQRTPRGRMITELGRAHVGAMTTTPASSTAARAWAARDEPLRQGATSSAMHVEPDVAARDPLGGLPSGTRGPEACAPSATCRSTSRRARALRREGDAAYVARGGERQRKTRAAARPSRRRRGGPVGRERDASCAGGAFSSHEARPHPASSKPRGWPGRAGTPGLFPDGMEFASLDDVIKASQASDQAPQTGIIDVKP